MAKGSKTVEALSSITGKGTTMTARSLASVATTLENKIRRLEAKETLTAAQKKQLQGFKRQLKDVNQELASEAASAGRSIAQKASDRKTFKGYTPTSPFKKGGMAKKTKKYNKGVMLSVEPHTKAKSCG